MKVIMHTAYRNGLFMVNDKVLAEPNEGDVEAGLRNAWDALGTGQPLDQRTDRLSRLAMLGTEPFFLTGAPLHSADRDTIGMVLMGRSGSLVTDDRYFTMIRDGQAASPALFVHTLPNIAIGMLSIRHRLHGAGLCLLNERPDTEQLCAATEFLAHEQGARSVICGWADTFADQATATFLLLGPTGTGPMDHRTIQGFFDKR